MHLQIKVTFIGNGPLLTVEVLLDHVCLLVNVISNSSVNVVWFEKKTVIKETRVIAEIKGM